jgi:uncharacterized protein (TIGR00299 family) protein
MAFLLFDILSGISGDMTVAAALSLGIKEKEFKKELKKLNLDFSVKIGKTRKCGIQALTFSVKYPKQKVHRHLHQIVKIINQSGLDTQVKNRSEAIFARLAEAEARVHNIDVNKVHFHEVGAVDAIVDIVGASLAFSLLGADAFYTTPFTFGHGHVKCDHGVMGVPVPATVELTKGFPQKRLDVAGELVTPTGAAIVTTLAQPVSRLGSYVTQNAGYGAGSKDLKDMPNVLRLLLGESDKGQAEQVVEIQTNVDDVTGEVVGRALEKLMESGALDVYTLPIGMKKLRPGILINVLCTVRDREKLSKILIRETGSIGIRYCEKQRICLPRTQGTVKTEWGRVKTKVIDMFGEQWITPEYESCKRVAQKARIPLRQVYAAVSRLTAR